MTRDRCYRELTPEGITPILCDMHRDGGAEAAGHKCPYYCDRDGCRRAARYDVEGGPTARRAPQKCCRTRREKETQ